MGNIGDAISPAVPAPGAAGPGYATDIDAILNEVVARLTKKVPLASLDVSSDLALNGASVTNARGYTFTDLEAVPSGSPSRRLAVFGGDVYYVSPSGTVQITTGASLNAAAVGGITGDYGGANPAQLRFDALNARYDAYANFGTGTWADVRARAFDVAAGATSVFSARLMFAGAANKTYTLPPAAASTAVDRPLYIDSAGQIKVGHGSHTLTYSSQGAQSPVETVVVKTTGDVFITVPRPSPITHGQGAVKSISTSVATGQVATKGVDGLPAGFKISSFTVNYFKVGNAQAFSYALKKFNVGTLIETTLASGTDNTIGQRNVTVALGAPHVVEPSSNYWFEVTFSTAGGAGQELWYGFQITGTMDP